MITYVDTSTLIKLLLQEVGSEEAEAIWDSAEVVTAARILYVEARATLAAARRDHRLTPVQLTDAKVQLDLLWDQVTVVEVDVNLISQAADLAEQHALRGYDAVHLAAAISVGAQLLTSADSRLCKAALKEEFHVANPVASAANNPVVDPNS